MSTACVAPAALEGAALEAIGVAALVFVLLGAGVLVDALDALDPLGVVLLTAAALDGAEVPEPTVFAACAKPLVPKASARLERASNWDTLVLSVFAFFISCILRVVGFNCLHENS